MFHIDTVGLAAYFEDSRFPVGVIDPDSLSVLYANREFTLFMETLYMALGKSPILSWSKPNEALREACATSRMVAFEDDELGIRLEFLPFTLARPDEADKVMAMCCVFGALAQGDALYEDILAHSPNNAWACSLSGEVFWTNRTSQMHRHGQEHHDLSNSAYVNKVHPDDMLMTATQFSTGMVEGRVEPFRFRLLDAHNQPKWFLFSAAPVRDKQGQVKFWTGTSVNIDSMVQHENSLKRGIERLEQDNLRLRTHLSEAQALMANIHKTDLVAHLAGGVAHDLNNMLFVMKMHLGALSRKASGADCEENLLALNDGVRNASRLSMQLSGFSGRLPQNAMPLSVLQVFQEAEPLFRQAVGAEAELVVRVPEGLGTVVVDKVYLENAIINLLINARDAMDGRGQIELQAQEEVLAQADGQRLVQVVISVHDHGFGMDEALQAKIFEPFFTTKTPDRGTGLGLAMVKNFVDSSGGSVRVASAPAKGSTIGMCFPCSHLDAEVSRRENEAALVRGEGIVMLIEDNIHVRKAVSMTLRELGYTLITATHIEQAMMLMDAGARPDVILSDIRMPGKYGVQDLLRHLNATDRIPVVFITGYSADVAIQAGLIDDQHPVLFKPVSSAELSIKLNEVMLQRGKPSA